MKKFRLAYALILMLLLFSVACKKSEKIIPGENTSTLSQVEKESQQTNNASTESQSLQKELEFDPNYDVYVVGSYHNGQFNQACYWKNAVLYPVEFENTNSVSYDIGIDGQNIYLVGQMLSKPCLWKNGKRENLNIDNWEGYATKTITNKGTVYIIGRVRPNPQTYYMPVLWIVDQNLQIEEILLENIPTQNQSANALDIIGDELYITGMYQQVPCYWKWSNGVLDRIQIASHFGSARGITIYNGDEYIFGNYDVNSNNTYQWGYWLNGQYELFNLSSSMPNYTVISSTISTNGKIYSIGHSYFPNNASTYASFWNDTGIIAQQLSNEESGTSDIEVLPNDDTYISGRWFNIACVWKNGVIYKLDTPYSHGTGIEVVVK